jgi:hypothetical protein
VSAARAAPVTASSPNASNAKPIEPNLPITAAPTPVHGRRRLTFGSLSLTPIPPLVGCHGSIRLRRHTHARSFSGKQTWQVVSVENARWGS